MNSTLLANERKRRGLRQRDLAVLLHVSTSAIANIESRRIVAWPKMRHALADLFNMNESDLFDTDGRPL